jgi:hypothetical protein
MRRQGGFALLITVTLLAFLVLLLVSLASLTRVETQVANNNQQLAQARQNALMGLNIALGQLQKNAGPDRRITARSDMAGSPVQPYLTGVWDSTAASLDPAAPLTWLISGNEGADPLAIGPGELDPSTAATDDEVLLLGDATVGSADLRIKANKQPILSDTVPGVTGSQQVGAYAWWVGDEGVKANAALLDFHADEAADERVYSFISSQRAGIAHVITGYPTTSDKLEDILSLSQIPLAAAASQQASVSLGLRNGFHDFTTYSASVLADVAAGGLKKDLTAWLSPVGTLPADAPADDDPIIAAASGGTDFMMPQWGIIRSWNALRTDGSTPVDPRAQTQSQQGVYPVVTYVRMGLAVSQGEPLGPPQPFQVHVYPTVVLWNPFNVPIEGAYEFCFTIRNESIPARYIQYTLAGAGTTKSFDARFWRMTDGPASSEPYLRFAVANVRINPGESRVFTLADAEDGLPYTAGAHTLVNALNTNNSVVIASTGNLTPAERDSTVQWGTAGGTEIDVVLRAPGLPAPSGPDWYQPLPGAYYTVQRVGFGSAGSMPATAVNPVANGSRFYWLVNSRISGSAASARWIAQHNPRAPFQLRFGSDASAQPSFNAGPAHSTSPPSFPAAPLASAATNVTSNPIVNLVLAEFLPPDVPLFSLAQLQHANLSLLGSQPTYAAGNSLADYHIPLTATSFGASPSGTSALSSSVANARDMSYLLNEALWDRYFLSTVPDSLTEDELADASYRLPNGRHRFRADSALDEVQGRGTFDTAAAHMVLMGGFNVNSTSEAAWRALLSSRNGLDYDPETGGVTGVTLAYPYSRFVRPSGGVNGGWSGYRQLTSAQIDRLAFNIVREVKARGPFRSLADFVNRRLQAQDTTAGLDGGAGFKGVLQAAIDRTDYETAVDGGPPLAPINTNSIFTTDYLVRASVRPVPVVGVGDPDHNIIAGGTGTNRVYSSRSAFAPGYLTQADVLNAVGSSLTARSDTFIIRAYGEQRNPVTEVIEGRAWCEAVVRRQPEYVEPALDPSEIPVAGTVNADFGRRFQVVSFRWLGPNDL